MSLTNTFIGYRAGADASQNASAENSTAIGANAYTTESDQVALGDDAVSEIRACATALYRVSNVGDGSVNAWLADAGNLETGNQGNVGIGFGVLANATTTSNAVGIGNLALSAHTGSNGVTAVGSRAMRDSIDCIDTTAFGNRALACATTGVGTTAVGFRAMEFSTESRTDTAVGDSAFWLWQGNGGVAVGYRTAEYTTAGVGSVYVGRAAGVNRADGDNCVFVGSEAGSFYSATIDPDTGAGAVSAGDRVIGVGYRALALTTGDDHVGVGHQAGLSLTGGSDCVFIGTDAGNNGSQKVDAVNAVAIGADAYATADNQVVLGGAAITHTALRGSVGIGLGLTAPSALLHVEGSTGAHMPLFVRKEATDGMANVHRVRALRVDGSGNPAPMGDNFGAAVAFQAEDDGGVVNQFGVVGAIRKGADTTSELQARPFTSGVLAEGLVVRDRQAIVGWNTTMVSGGSAGVGWCMSTTPNFGVFFGSGAPTIAAAKGSLYMRSDGSGTNDRMYVNTDGSTTWTAVVTVA
jgi:hypothetical protein